MTNKMHTLITVSGTTLADRMSVVITVTDTEIGVKFYLGLNIHFIQRDISKAKYSFIHMLAHCLQCQFHNICTSY